jgi:hypothetical protein
MFGFRLRYQHQRTDGTMDRTAGISSDKYKICISLHRAVPHQLTIYTQYNGILRYTIRCETVLPHRPVHVVLTAGARFLYGTLCESILDAYTYAYEDPKVDSHNQEKPEETVTSEHCDSLVQHDFYFH